MEPQPQGVPVYTAKDIVVLPFPALVVSGGRCRRTYRYQFCVPVPEREELEELAARLSRRFRVLAPALGERVFIEIPIDVEFSPHGQCEVDVSICSSYPEEDPVFLYGRWTLPKELEKAIGRVESIEGHPREEWSTFRSGS